MPSIQSAMLRAEIKMIRPILRRLDIEGERRAQDALGRLGAKALAEKVCYRPEPFDRFEAEWACPASAVPGRASPPDHSAGAVLYLHGGSYTSGSLDYAKGFGGILADTLKKNILCAAYRLAPEHPFPAAVDDAEQAYLRMLETYAPSGIAVVGESAGGGLGFALMLRLKQKGLPLPACLVAISPWADLRCKNPSYETKAGADPCLFADALRDSAALYADGDTENPEVSPVLGDLSGFPPCLIFVGSDEILLDDSLSLARALKRFRVPFELVVADGMWHVYCVFGIPEAREALTRIDRFLGETLFR